jgi:hypothetical protein
MTTVTDLRLGRHPAGSSTRSGCRPERLARASVGQRDIPKRETRRRCGWPRKVARTERRGAREHRPVVGPGFEVSGAKAELELGERLVLELRTARFVLRHARHRGGVVRHPVIELARQRALQPQVNEHRERKQHDGEHAEHRRGETRAERAH